MKNKVFGLFTNMHDIEQTVLTAKNGTALRVKDVAELIAGTPCFIVLASLPHRKSSP
jgi:Cu/Ag efflux pump CusA